MRKRAWISPWASCDYQGLGFMLLGFQHSLAILQGVLIFNKKVSNGKLSFMLMLPFVFSLMGTLVGATA
jgi:hypothetical protein